MRVAFALLLCSFVSSWATTAARADDSVTAAASDGVSADPELRMFLAAGYGTQDDGDAGSFGPALGLKGSYALMRWLHLGLHGSYHVGTRFGDEINRVHYAGVEAGARFADAHVGVTPYLMGGVASVSSQRNTESTFAAAYLGLGAHADVVVINWLLVGIDARLISIPAGVQQSDNAGSLGTIDLLLLLGARL